MMEKYDHKKIEAKWRKKWEKEKLYQTSEDKTKPKYYVLDMFPYPSGAGLHVGHPKGYIATDIFARAKMMQGFNVLHPMGWDAFGLPAENFAIANKVHPREATEKNIATFKRQLGLLGFTYDWDREINTTDPEYYKWTQWAFIKMFERGLAYESNEPVNWCPDCKTVLSNEDLEDGKCERCGSVVERKPMRQWVLKITDYADRLLNDLEKLPAWEESIKEMQRNWIGRSEGTIIKFPISNDQFSIKSQNPNGPKFIEVFTTRVDTVFGCTYAVLAPEHELIRELKNQIKNWSEVEKYIEHASHKSDLQRMESKEKTGIELKGIKAVNPFNNEEVPIFAADYVLAQYGTGAVMAVPAHDERDWEFAKKYNLPIKNVVAPYWLDQKDKHRADKETEKREVACIILKNPKDNKYLGLKWSLTGWQSFPTGGLDGQDLVSAARREIKEETGYKNLKFIKQLPGSTYAEFYRPHKGSNVIAHFYYLIFELENEEKEDVHQDEKDRHEAVWISEKEIEAFINVENQKFALKKYFHGDFAYCYEGILTESGEYSGLKSAEAREKMIAWLEKEGLGRRQVNYKLRDWVFSRQRYWGEPIPIVHCQSCKDRKYHYVILHGYTATGCKNGPAANLSNNWRPWLKNKLEQDGHTVYCPDLPNTNEPNINEQVDFVLKNTKIDENTILIGHSLGAVVIYKLLEKLNKKVKKVLLVDPVVAPNFSDRPRPMVEKSNDWKFNWGKIKKSTHEFIVLGDAEFKTILEKDLKDLSSRLEGRLVLSAPQARHFTGAIEPSVLKYALMDGIYTVPEKELPLKLPEVKNYEPTGTGESPLANIKDWVNTTCPKCGGPAKRETNTMPQWAGSSWYYLRYIDPHNKKELVDKAKEKYWSPVDFYVGGAEHATRHLIYARFWHKFLFDVGVVNYDEPFTRLQHVGLILAEDGRKMSKRWGNVINPDEIVEKFGADAMRVYEMFMGPFSQPCAWSTRSLIGGRRFLENVYKLKDKKLYDCKGGDCKIKESGLPQLLHKTIKKVSEDIENFHYNTAISQMMIFVNFASKLEAMPRGAFENFLKLLAPFAPHLAEELWSEIKSPQPPFIKGGSSSIFKQPWPKFNLELVKDETINLVLQVNGKVRETIEVSADISEEEAKKIALASEKIKKWTEGKDVIKVIFVKAKLVNVVVK